LNSCLAIYLKNFKNLEAIEFRGNNLKIIEPNILDGLERLKYVDFRENLNYWKFYSIHYEDNPNATLEEIKWEIFEKYPQFLKDLKKCDENSMQEIRQLKDSKLKLELELEQEKLKNSELIRNPQKGFFVDLKTFTEQETTKDINIQIGDRFFPVHKFLLAARSTTLAEMLKNNQEVENLNLVDISKEIFEIILKFLYTDELPAEDGTNFLQLFAAAGKLKIQDLINYAASKLIEITDEENVLEVFKLSNKYGNEELSKKAFNEFKKWYPRCKFKNEWITNTEIVVKVIEQLKQAEEAIRKLEEEFGN